MRYWPLSVLRSSPRMPSVFAWELSRFYTHPPSEPAFYACLNVAAETRPVQMQGLVIIESVNAPMRLAYTEYPTWEEWAQLERAFVIEGDNDTRFVMMESLH